MADEKIGIHEFIQNHLPYKTKLWIKIGFTVLVLAAAVYGYNTIQDLRKENAAQKAIAETLNQKVQQLGTSVVTGNQQGTQKDVNAAGQLAFGKSVIDFMAVQNAKLEQLTSAVGKIDSRITASSNLSQADLTSHQDQTTGSLSGFPMNESRSDATGKPLPPLSKVTLFYNTKAANVNEAFKGTFWTHNTENFTVTTGKWDNKDGKLLTTVSLKRGVYTVDPVTQTQTLVGIEDIPLTDGNTIFSPGSITGPVKVLPRRTVTFGAGPGSAGGFFDYRFTDRFGVAVGIVNQNTQNLNSVKLLVGGSYRF